MSIKVKEFLGEKAGQTLRADVYQEGATYTIQYFINGAFVKEEAITGHSMFYIEDACNNWLDGIKTLNG